MNVFDEEDAAKCPRCNSTQLHAEKISYYHATSNKIMISCLKCGYQYKLKKQPVPDRLSIHLLERAKDFYVTCPNCGKLSSTACYACPKCGRKFLQEDFEKATKIRRWGCLPVIFLGIIAFPLLFFI